MNKRRIGNYGEILAAAYLEENGFFVQYENYLTKGGEVDIIATKGDILHFIEVKTLKDNGIIMPREKVDGQKQRRLRKASREFLEDKGDFDCSQFSFDIIEVTINEIEGAF